MPKPMGRRGRTPVDLDVFLSSPQGGGNSFARPPGALALEMPQSDRMNVVGFFADDSSSLRHLREAVIAGLKLGVKAFQRARGSDFFLDVRGFRGTYFQGMLRDVTESSFDGYSPEYGSTPLVAHARPHLRALRERAGEYRKLGIPTKVSMLVITDGMPNEDELPAAFSEDVQAGDYVAGMGIVYDDGNEATVAAGVGVYSDLFRAMGIKKILTPKSTDAEVRHSMDEFSQSVAAVA